jgi:phage I-like protein
MNTFLHTAYCQAVALPEGGDVPEWVHLVPAGTIETVDGRGPYRLDQPEEIARQSVSEGGRLVLDENHSTDLAAPHGAGSPARGWIVALQARQDGIWGGVEWTETGKAIVGERAYRFISPVINHTKEGVITRILRASLVNRPNLRGLTALASAEVSGEKFLSELRGLLGLAADASSAAILDQIRELNAAKQSPDPAQFVPIEELARATAEVQRLSQGVSLQAAKDHVSRQISSANMPPFLRDWGIALCTVNRPAFDAFVERTKGFFNKLVAPSGAKSTPPEFGKGTPSLTEEETALCMRMGLTPEEYGKSREFLQIAKG